MPTRIIREGILTSEAINQLSERAELFYRRLMSVADDYGRFFAHPSILRASCFPMKVDKYSDGDIRKMLNECQATTPQPLITVYGSGKYLLIRNFGQQTRSKSKFPEPTQDELLIKCKSIDEQMCSLVGVGVVVGDVVEGEISSSADDGFDRFWKAYPRKIGKQAARSAWKRSKGKPTIDAILAAIETQKQSDAWRKDGGQFIPHPTTWINQGRWHDETNIEVEAYEAGRI